jgi:hypothetical protein
MPAPFNRRRGPFIPTLALCALLAGASDVWACPFCKEALGSSQGDLVSGFFYSILFMLSMPFMIITGMGTYMYVLVRRARIAREAASQAEPGAHSSPQG